MPRKTTRPEPNAEERRSEAKDAAAAAPVGLQILEMYVENIKRVRVAHIRPKGSMVVIAGKNGSGKTSVLDAIAWGLTGTATVPSQPIRTGARTGKVQLDLGDFIVTRYFTRVENSAKGNTYLTRLVVEGKRREQFPNPQTLLNELMGRISFDPLKFLRMDQKHQVETLRGLVTFDVDIDALDAAQQADYEERRIAGRGVDSAKARLDAMSAPPAELPAEPINTAAIARRMQEATAHNETVAKALRDKEGLQAMAVQMQERANQDRRLALEALTKATEIDGAIVEVDIKQLDPPGGKVGELLMRAGAIPLGEPVDVAELARELEHANQVNGAIGRATVYRETQHLLEQSETLWAEIDKRMKERAAEREAAIERAKMPIAGLGIGDGEVLYNALPFSQASNAEQIRVSMALAMASNPKLRVLRISDGALLDDDSLQLVAEEAEKHGFQVWIERVDTSGKVAVVMEEGEATGEQTIKQEKF